MKEQALAVADVLLTEIQSESLIHNPTIRFCALKKIGKAGRAERAAKVASLE